MTEVRYFSPSGRRPVASTFKATVDLANVPAGTGPVLVPVQVISLDPTEIQVIGYTPDRVTIDLDTVAEKQVPVRIEQPPPPAGLTTGDTVVEPSTVTVSGPTSKVDTVVAVRADVIIQPSGISIDQDVPVVPIDANGQQVSPIELDPDVVHVTIPVFQDVRNRSLPVTPVVTGTPAPGFEIAVGDRRAERRDRRRRRRGAGQPDEHRDAAGVGQRRLRDGRGRPSPGHA